MKRLKVKGFSMIELLIVLLIIGILASVAGPMFIGNSDKSKASEAVAGLGALRSTERTYFASYNQYTVDGVIYNTGASTEIGNLLGVSLAPAKYFSNSSYAFKTGTNFSDGTTAINFIIGANGSTSAGSNQYAGANKAMNANGGTGARNFSEVSNIKVEMDDSGRIMYSTTGSNWREY